MLLEQNTQTSAAVYFKILHLMQENKNVLQIQSN